MIEGTAQETPKNFKSTGPSTFGFHRIHSFMVCPQMYAYRWEACLVPAYEKPATATGTLIHEGLRAYYQDEDPDRAIEAMPARYSPFVQRARAIVERYIQHYKGDRPRVLAVEKEYQVTIAGRLFTRRLDLVVEQRGMVFVIDHKTAAQPMKRGDVAHLEWSLATQELVGRALLPAELKRPWGGVILNVIPTNDHMVGFRRIPLHFSANMLEVIPRSLDYYLEQIDALKHVNIFRYPRSGNCVDRYGTCEYLRICTGGEQNKSEFVTDWSRD